MISSITRRKFVILGSSGIAAVAINSPAFGASGASSVAIGYFGATRTLRGRSPVQRSFVDAASGGVVGDGALLDTEAVFRIHDAQFRQQSSVRLALDVVFTDENGDSRPFHAFSSALVRGRRSSSNGVSFNVPVAPSSSVALRIEYGTATGDASVEMIRLNVNANGMEIPLASGLYAIALIGQGQAKPEWRSIRPVGLDEPESKTPITLSEDRFTGTQAVAFDYVLFTVAPRATPVLEPEVAASERKMVDDQ